MLDWNRIDSLIEDTLTEDFGDRGDVTSDSILSSGEVACAELVAKEDGILSGLSVFQRVFQLIDREIGCEFLYEDGDTVKNGEKIGEISGPLNSLLKGERTALNLLQRMSGIATLTSRYVREVEGTNAVILDTRKTTPLLRQLEKYSVKQGGGSNHRFGLYDMVMIKDNHIDGAGGITPAVEKCVQYLQKSGIQIFIEVETRTLDEVKEALTLPIQRIMLDNMDIDTMNQAVRLVNKKVETEASGNVSLSRVKAIALTGVDFISVGKLTHSAKAMDISLRIL